jgi:uncharacterized protein YndB with AHSA1/START domain
MTTLKAETPVRSIELEVEVPGTPEQVWQAIATGPGITSWFVPTEVEERTGGAIAFHLGPGADSSGIVTAWEPPHRLAYEEREWSPGALPLATEMLVEARSGGTCLVRIVSSLFTSRADWDDQLESMKTGWPPFLRVLRLYLAHFAGQRCSPIQLSGSSAGPQERAWSALMSALRVAEVAEGARASTAGSGAPPLSGIVEHRAARELLLRLDEPGPGAALAFVYDMGEQAAVSLHLHLYGVDAAAVAAREGGSWQEWMERSFPAATADKER